MELDNDNSVPELIACPEPSCMAPAAVADRFVLASTEGPVEHAKTSCLDGHGFTMPAEALTDWPLPRAARAAGTGG